jgi:hypothetical protein
MGRFGRYRNITGMKEEHREFVRERVRDFSAGLPREMSFIKYSGAKGKKQEEFNWLVH